MSELTSVEEFESFIDFADDASVVAGFHATTIPDPSAKIPDGWDEEEDGEWQPPMIENPTYTTYSAAKQRAYNFRFGYTTNPDVLALLKQKSKAGVYLYRAPRYVSKEHGDRARERYPSDNLNEDTLVKWLETKAQPLVGPWTYSTKDRYTGATLIIYFNLDYDNNAKTIKYVLKRARKVALELKGKLSIAVASIKDLSHELSNYGLESDKHSSDIRMGIQAGGKNYGAPEAPFTATSLTDFAKGFLAGKLTPYEAPEPATSNTADDEDGDDDYSGEDGDDDGEGADMKDEP